MNIEFPNERAIEEYVYRSVMDGKDCPITATHPNAVFRQYEIKGYGITDLVYLNIYPGMVRVQIVELKNETLKESHLSQLKRYMVGMRRYLWRHNDLAEKAGWEIDVHGVLAGPFEADRNDLVYLYDGMEDVEIFGLSLSMEDGFLVREISNSGWRSRGEDLTQKTAIARHAFPLALELDRSLSRGAGGNVINFEGLA